LNEEYLGKPGVKVKIILRRILKKQEVRVWTEFGPGWNQ
jgi:hypothetical protein